MLSLATILPLADSNWVFGVIVFAFVILANLASWANKQKQEQERRRRELLRQQVGHFPGTEPARAPAPTWTPPPTAPQLPRPPRTGPKPPPIPPRAQAPLPQRKVKKVKPPKPPRRAPAPEPVPAPPVEIAPPVAAVHAISVEPVATGPAPTQATAGSLRRYLTPANLRAQYILTELLRPPVALRSPDDR